MSAGQQQGGEPGTGEPGTGKPGTGKPQGVDTLEGIGVEIARCRLCRLATGRNRVVPGTGSPHPLVMVIGEGPGSEEDKSGIPFVGPAGQLLDKMLSAIGLSRETNCFIGNIVKCRPPLNRDPAPDEQFACMPYLDRQIEILKPQAFLAVGRIPAQALLGVKDGIGKLRGKRYEYKGVPLVATYHPSALLRDETYKRPAWEDLKLLKSILDGLA
jgi:DNA polymerase